MTIPNLRKELFYYGGFEYIVSFLYESNKNGKTFLKCIKSYKINSMRNAHEIQIFLPSYFSNIPRSLCSVCTLE